MTAALFPTYFLARTILSKPWALFAAIGAVATPALAYAPVPRRGARAYPWARSASSSSRRRSVAERWRAIAPPRPSPARARSSAASSPSWSRSTRSRSSSCSGPAPGSRPGGTGRSATGSAPWSSAIGAIILFSAVVGAHSQTLVHLHRLLPAPDDRLRAVGGGRVHDRARAAAGGLRWPRWSGRGASSGRGRCRHLSR